MIRVSLALLVSLFVLCAAVAYAGQGDAGKVEKAPSTAKEGNPEVKQGGREIGAGFRSLGHGIKNFFTGKSSKEDFKETKKIGTGFGDVGRGVGHDVKKGFKKGDETKQTEESR